MIPIYLILMKYFSIEDLEILKIANQFNIFHSNVYVLESNFDVLRDFLANSQQIFEVVNRTETSQVILHRPHRLKWDVVYIYIYMLKISLIALK